MKQLYTCAECGTLLLRHPTQGGHHGGLCGGTLVPLALRATGAELLESLEVTPLEKTE